MGIFAMTKERRDELSLILIKDSLENGIFSEGPNVFDNVDINTITAETAVNLFKNQMVEELTSGGCAEIDDVYGWSDDEKEIFTFLSSFITTIDVFYDADICARLLKQGMTRDEANLLLFTIANEVAKESEII